MHLPGLRQSYLARCKDRYQPAFSFEWRPIAASASAADSLLYTIPPISMAVFKNVYKKSEAGEITIQLNK